MGLLEKEMKERYKELKEWIEDGSDDLVSISEFSVLERIKLQKTLIICAFPGTGKTTFYNKKKDLYKKKFILDSDSSTFDKTLFPDNYVMHIQEKLGKDGIILVSSHKIVREALVNKTIRFIFIYPELGLKKEYLKQYKDRGSSPELIDVIDINWKKWITEARLQKGCFHYELASGEYISDLF